MIGQVHYHVARPVVERRHYHVGMNIPGYLPDGDVEVYTRRKDAERRAAEMKRQVLEDNWEPEVDRWVASGSARSGDIWLERPDVTYDLGLHIWIHPCEDDCSLSAE